VLADPTATFDLRSEGVELLRHRALRAIASRVNHETSSIEHSLARVRAMSPKATLERGYVILVDGDGHGVTSVLDVDEDDDLLAHLVDGQLILSVREVQPGHLGATS